MSSVVSENEFLLDSRANDVVADAIKSCFESDIVVQAKALKTCVELNKPKYVNSNLYDAVIFRCGVLTECVELDKQIFRIILRRCYMLKLNIIDALQSLFYWW